MNSAEISPSETLLLIPLGAITRATAYPDGMEIAFDGDGGNPDWPKGFRLWIYTDLAEKLVQMLELAPRWRDPEPGHGLRCPALYQSRYTLRPPLSDYNCYDPDDDDYDDYDDEDYKEGDEDGTVFEFFGIHIIPLDDEGNEQKDKEVSFTFE